MVQKLLFLWLQFDGKMRPSDRLPYDDSGPTPSLSEYFIHLGIGIACILLLFLLVKLKDKVEDKSKILTGVLVLIGLAALFGSWYCLLPLLEIWYTWVIVGVAYVIIVISLSIWEHNEKKKHQKKQEIERRKWKEYASFEVFPSTEKPDPTKKPIPAVLRSRLESKTENGKESFFIDRKYLIEYNPFYLDASVGEWGTFQFRSSYYIDSFQKKKLAYMYYNIPEDVLYLVDTEQRYMKSKESELVENQGFIDDDLPF